MWQKTFTYFHTLLTQDAPEGKRVPLGYYGWGILVLLLCGWKLYQGLENTMDIQFADEAAYIRFGLDMFGTFNRNWGPLYCLWYKLLSYINPDTLFLYYLNYKAVSVALAVLLYVFLLRIQIHPLLALLAAFCILVSNLNVAVWPRISHFCIALLLLLLIATTFIRTVRYKLFLFAVLALFISYARPEFYLSFLLLMLVTALAVFWKRDTLGRKDLLVFISGLVLIGILHAIFRFPSNDFFGYNRGVAAFYQHYAYNYKIRTNAPIDSWLYWEEICKQQFGDCNSMWCVIKTQPMIVISNTLFNIKNYLLTTYLNDCSYIFPYQLFASRKWQLLCLGMLTIVGLFTLTRSAVRRNWWQELHGRMLYLCMLLLFIAPTILSCVVVFPREHYVYLQMPLVLLTLLCLLQPFFSTRKYPMYITLMTGILFFLSTPNIKNYAFLKVNNTTSYLCNKELVKHLKQHYSDTPHTLFTNMPFVRGMLPENFREINTIFDKKKHMPFRHYLDSAHIDLVILTPSTFRDPHISNDSSWLDFIERHETYGFRKEKYNDCETYLLVKTAQ